MVDALAPQIGLAHLDAGLLGQDPRIERAMREMFSKGKVPGPTRMFGQPVQVAQSQLDLDFDGDRFRKDGGTGRYLLELADPRTSSSCQLELQLENPPIRYGSNGVVAGWSNTPLFCYFVPRAKVTGSFHHRWQSGSSRDRLRLVRALFWDNKCGNHPTQLTKTDQGRRNLPAVALHAARTWGESECIFLLPVE